MSRRQTKKETDMPTVTIQQGPRTVELKRDLIKRITDAFVDAYQIPAEAVEVWFQETAPDSWGRAGKLTADK
nr:4-oxalocrotonate tautomerase DmpI [Fodinicola acaciae]